MSKRNWEEGTIQDFLGLSDAEMALVETKVVSMRTPRSMEKGVNNLKAESLTFTSVGQGALPRRPTSGGAKFKAL